jgi:hypothetical protein
MRFGFQRSFVSFLREISPELILLAVMFVAVMAIRLPIGNIYYSFIVKGVIMFALYGLLLVLTGDWKLIRNVLLSPKKKENA